MSSFLSSKTAGGESMYTTCFAYVYVFVFVDLFLVFYVGRHVGSLNVCFV